MLIRGSDRLRLYISQCCAPQLSLILLCKTGKHEITYPVVLCFVVLERGNGDEVGWRQRRQPSTVSVRRIHSKDPWKPRIGFISYTTEEAARKPPRDASPERSPSKIRPYRGGGCARSGTQDRVGQRSGSTLCWVSPCCVRVRVAVVVP